MQLKNIDKALRTLQSLILAAIVIFIIVACLDPFIHSMPEVTLCIPRTCL